MSTHTTSGNIPQFRILPDGRKIGLLKVRKFTEVEVCWGEGGLCAGDSIVVQNDLCFEKRGFKMQSETDLQTTLESAGHLFPGAYLFDLLLKKQDLIPPFGKEDTLIFLGSKVICFGEKEEEVIVAREQVKVGKKPILQRLAHLFKGEREPETEVVEETTIKKEDGFFALKKEDGEILPWFVSCKQFLELVKAGDKHHFVLELEAKL